MTNVLLSWILTSTKYFDHAEKSATDALKTSSKRVFQKTEEANDYLIGNKIAEKITSSASRSKPEVNTHTAETPEVRYASPGKTILAHQQLLMS